jgi:excisionase family DNA binding protein
MLKLFFKKILRRDGEKWIVLHINPPLPYSQLKPTDLLNTRELVNLFNISRRQIYRWINQGKIIPYREISGEYLFRKKDIEKFCKMRRLPGRPRKKLERRQEAFII